MNAKREYFMRRALELAKKAFPACMPNPGVGAVVVKDNKIIGEGHTQSFGGKHAEVMAIESVKIKEQLKGAEIYVSLEPCNHFGKTPPCSQLIKNSGITKVNIATEDPFESKNGKGIGYLKSNQIEVETGLLKSEAQEQNKRFLHFHSKKRPYIILKWAQSLDHFIAPENQSEIHWISSLESQQLVHQWRAEEMAILVGTHTAIKDNPSLNVRHVSGKNPIRILIDRELKVPFDSNIYSDDSATYVFNSKYNSSKGMHHWIHIDFDGTALNQMLSFLHSMNIQSIIIEGGAKTLELLIEKSLWDEARIFTSKNNLEKGLKAPKLKGDLICSSVVGSDILNVFLKTN